MAPSQLLKRRSFGPWNKIRTDPSWQAMASLAHQELTGKFPCLIEISHWKYSREKWHTFAVSVEANVSLFLKRNNMKWASTCWSCLWLNSPPILAYNHREWYLIAAWHTMQLFLFLFFLYLICFYIWTQLRSFVNTERFALCLSPWLLCNIHVTIQMYLHVEKALKLVRRNSQKMMRYMLTSGCTMPLT